MDLRKRISKMKRRQAHKALPFIVIPISFCKKRYLFQKTSALATFSTLNSLLVRLCNFLLS